MERGNESEIQDKDSATALPSWHEGNDWLRWSDNAAADSPAKFESRTLHLLDRTAFYCGWFTGHAPQDHGFRIHFQFGASMERRTTSHDIWFSNIFERHLPGEQLGDCNDCKVDCRQSVARRWHIPRGRFFRQ